MTVLELRERLGKSGLEKQHLREVAIELTRSSPCPCPAHPGLLGVPRHPDTAVRQIMEHLHCFCAGGALLHAALGGEALVQTGQVIPHRYVGAQSRFWPGRRHPFLDDGKRHLGDLIFSGTLFPEDEKTRGIAA